MVIATAIITTATTTGYKSDNKLSNNSYSEIPVSS